MTTRSISKINRSAGGSTLTRVGREANLRAISNHLKTELNIQVKSFAGLKVAHIEKLVASWKADSLSSRTMQNKMAHVRTALREVGREKFASDTRINNQSLGIGGASRTGTHASPGRAEIESRMSAMPPGARAAAGLQLELGLRAREAIQSVQSLSTWSKELARTGMITVVHGTKGGRARVVDLRDPEARSRAVEAVDRAAEAVKQEGGKLIPSETLQGAARAYQRAMADAGFKAAEASHALRCQFAKEQYDRHLQATESRREALSRLSLDLGHGDGRGRYCAQVYLPRD